MLTTKSTICCDRFSPGQVVTKTNNCSINFFPLVEQGKQRLRCKIDIYKKDLYLNKL